MRIMSGETPAVICSSSDNWRWVVEAGWITSVRASPTLARWLMNCAASMKASPAPGQVFLGERVVAVGSEAGIVHPAHLRMRFQKLRHLERVVAMRLHAQMQRLQALQQHP